MPASRARGAARFRFSTTVRRRIRSGTPGGRFPARTLSRRQPTVGPPPPRPGSSSGDGRAAPGRRGSPGRRPRKSPPSGSKSTSSRPCCSSSRSTAPASTLWMNRNSTARKPEAAAFSKRSEEGHLVVQHRQVRGVADHRSLVSPGRGASVIAGRSSRRNSGGAACEGLRVLGRQAARHLGRKLAKPGPGVVLDLDVAAPAGRDPGIGPDHEAIGVAHEEIPPGGIELATRRHVGPERELHQEVGRNVR